VNFTIPDFVFCAYKLFYLNEYQADPIS